ncbi:MFS transporter [Micromonospora haikouensis]|uniref:MFS transporter n=1 Tax=Micromonospora haikouensis TaxID=686309 RepID=UPI0036A4C2C7
MSSKDLSPADSRRWLALGVVATAQLMIVLDLAVVFVALPQMQTDLSISLADRQWVVSGYAIAFGGLLLLGGRLVDYLGQKRMFLAALVGFAVASALGGLADNGVQLFAARALQGAFAAVVAPAVLSLISVTFTEQADRARAFAVYGMVSGSGAAVGLLLGGVLTQYASWRWCLLVNVPIVLVTVVLAVATLRPDPPAVKGRRYDLAGALTATLGLVCLANGLTLAEANGWISVVTLGSLAAGVLLLGVFVLVEARSRQPLLPLRIVSEPHRALLYLAALLANGAQLSMFLFLTFYFQNTRGYGAVQTGLAFLPFALAIITTAQFSAPAVVRFGPLPVMSVGALTGAAGLFTLTRLGVDSPYPTAVLIPLVLIGVGVAMSLFPLNNVVLLGIDPKDAGVASAVVSTTQQMGASMVTALLNTLFAGAVAGYLLTRPSEGAAATMHGYRVVFGWESALYLAAFVLILLAQRRVRRAVPDQVKAAA